MNPCFHQALCLFSDPPEVAWKLKMTHKQSHTLVISQNTSKKLQASAFLLVKQSKLMRPKWHRFFFCHSSSFEAICLVKILHGSQRGRKVAGLLISSSTSVSLFFWWLYHYSFPVIKIFTFWYYRVQPVKPFLFQDDPLIHLTLC